MQVSSGLWFGERCGVEGLGFRVGALGFRVELFKVLESCGRNGLASRAEAAFYR